MSSANASASGTPRGATGAAAGSSAPLRWSYALNCWKPGFMGFARREEHERAFKVTSAAGFRAVELNAGSGRWEPLGRPENVATNYGSAQKFLLQLNDWGIDRVSSTFWDPGQMSFEDLHHGLLPSNPSDHAQIVATVRLHAELLPKVGGEILVVRPAPSFSREGAMTPERLRTIADCWTAAGKVAGEHGVRLALHVDALSAFRTADEIEALLAATPDAHVGLAIDTAEVTIAGHDPLALYERCRGRVFHFQFKNALARDELGEYRQPNAERVLIQCGGERRIARWFGELDHREGLVDFRALVAALRRDRYAGWIVVESDKGPAPIASAVLRNGWYVQNVLDPAAKLPRGNVPVGAA